MNPQPSLTSKQRNRIMHLLATAPTSINEYFTDLESERLGEPDTFETVVLKRANRFEIWSTESGTNLEFHGVFISMKKAKEAEKVFVSEVMEEARQCISDLHAEAWAARPGSRVSWEYPMRFRDNTDFQHGSELNSEAEVLDFFQRVRFHIFEEEAPGSIYTWDLQDASGQDCCPVRSHSGGIRLESPEPHPHLN